MSENGTDGQDKRFDKGIDRETKMKRESDGQTRQRDRQDR